MQAGIEPLWRVWRDHLAGEHVTLLVEEGLCIVFRLEIAALPAPIGPAAGKAIENLLGAHLGAETLVLGQFGEFGFIRHRAPQEGRNVVFLNLLQMLRHAGLAEIFLRQNVGCHLAERFWHIDVFKAENDRAVRIADFAGGRLKIYPGIGRNAGFGEKTLDPHDTTALKKYRLLPAKPKPGLKSAKMCFPCLPIPLSHSRDVGQQILMPMNRFIGSPPLYGQREPVIPVPPARPDNGICALGLSGTIRVGPHSAMDSDRKTDPSSRQGLNQQLASRI